MPLLQRRGRAPAHETPSHSASAPVGVNGAPTPDAPEAIDIAPTGERLGERLLRSRAVRRAELVDALSKQRDGATDRLGELLVGLGALSEADLVKVLAAQSGVSLIDLREVEPDPEAVASLTEIHARSLNAVPLRRLDDGRLEVVVDDPTDTMRERIEALVGGPVTLVAAAPAAVRQVVQNTYRALSGVTEFVQRFESADAIRRALESVGPDLSMDDAPVVQVVNLLVTQALRDRASDVHVEQQDHALRVRYRIDGALHDALTLPVTMGPALISRLKIMAGLNIVERRRPQDGHISTSVDGRDLDIRVATSPTIWGEKAVLRLLDKSRPLFRLSDLGMGEETEARYGALVRSPFGMVVCAGPTGSGKTTSLYATLMATNDAERNITTIEDPVEYVVPSINQIAVNEAAGVTFAAGLPSILRQDPDIILVGEIRDTETAQIAVRSALTGHLVLSSIHATDASSALHRFVEMGVEPFLVSSSLLAVMAQRLVRRICGYCRTAYKPTPDELRFYRESGGEAKVRFYRGTGCKFCAATGYQERIGVFELLHLTESMKELVVAGATRDRIRNAAVEEQGMRTLREEGLRLVSEDVTTIAEIVRSIWVM